MDNIQGQSSSLIIYQRPGMKLDKINQQGSNQP